MSRFATRIWSSTPKAFGHGHLYGVALCDTSRALRRLILVLTARTPGSPGGEFRAWAKEYVSQLTELDARAKMRLAGRVESWRGGGR